MSGVREFLLDSAAPKSVFWVEKDLNTADHNIRELLEDLIIRRSFGSTAAAFTLFGEHKILGVSPRSMDRARGLSADAVYIGNYSAFAKVAGMIVYSVAFVDNVYWFNADGPMGDPFL